MSNLDEIESHTNVAAHKIVLKLFQSCSGHAESAPSRRDAVFYTGGIGAHRGNANHQVLRRVGRYLYSPLVHTSPKLEGAEDGSVPNLESEGQISRASCGRCDHVRHGHYRKGNKNFETRDRERGGGALRETRAADGGQDTLSLCSFLAMRPVESRQ